jgi:Protein of unknown function (DUF2723)
VTNIKREFTGRDWALAALFFLTAIAVYAPFRSRMVYLWDSGEFTVAIRDYNAALCQPHPPGCFLYVMMGRLVNQFVGDPHASLVWMSVAAGAGVAAAARMVRSPSALRILCFALIASVILNITPPDPAFLWGHACLWVRVNHVPLYGLLALGVFLARESAHREPCGQSSGLA